VEIVRGGLDVKALAADHLSPADVRMLEDLPEADRLRAFYRLWTRREASAKAAGQCLATAGAGRPSAACGTCAIKSQPVAPPEAWSVGRIEAYVAGMDVVASVVIVK
jgi:hypothetical protein